jgi:8-oxo-dGTP pyrophosphatase MutT (NUDIX family)
MRPVDAPAGSAANPIKRRAARILLIDAAGRVLMFRGSDPARPGVHYWFTAGGGLDEGESPADGAARELAEETGLVVDPSSLAGPVWHQVTDFPFEGHWYRQEQDFFAIRVGSWDVVVDGFDAVERRSIDGHRWWSLAELAVADEAIYPEELPALLREVLHR